MKKTGIVRRLDELGRVVLPIELRRGLDWKDRDQIEIYVDEDRVILQKFETSCCFCGETKELKEYQGKLVCGKCIEKLGTL